MSRRVGSPGSVSARLDLLQQATTTVVARLRTLVGVPDPRDPGEIEADLADEFEFHLHLLRREEEAAGASPDDAHRLALERFGDLEQVRRACRRIALRERIMIQRVNAVLTVVLLLAVGALAVQVILGQRHMAATLAAIDSRLESIAANGTARLSDGAGSSAIDSRRGATESPEQGLRAPPSQDRPRPAAGSAPPSVPPTLAELESQFDRTRMALVTGEEIHPFVVNATDGLPIDLLLFRDLRDPVPAAYRPSLLVDATIRRPRGDGTDELIEAHWTGWAPIRDRELRKNFPVVRPADRIQLRLRHPAPLPALPEVWVLASGPNALRGALSVIDAAIASADDDELDAESLSRYHSERESIRLRLAAMGIDDVPPLEP